MEKQLGWTPKLGGAKSPGILLGSSNSVSQVDGVSDMAPAFSSMGRGFRKGTMASACLDASHFSSSLYVTGAFQATTLVLELRGSESEVSPWVVSLRVTI